MNWAAGWRMDWRAPLRGLACRGRRCIWGRGRATACRRLHLETARRRGPPWTTISSIRAASTSPIGESGIRSYPPALRRRSRTRPPTSIAMLPRPLCFWRKSSRATRTSVILEQMMQGDSDRIAEAVKLQLAGKLERAEQIYREVLETQPRHPAANHCLGMLHVQSGRAAAGLAFLFAALESSPQIPDYWLGYLEALLLAGQLEGAHAALAIARQGGLTG